MTEYHGLQVDNDRQVRTQRLVRRFGNALVVVTITKTTWFERSGVAKPADVRFAVEVVEVGEHGTRITNGKGVTREELREAAAVLAYVVENSLVGDAP